MNKKYKKLQHLGTYAEEIPYTEQEVIDLCSRAKIDPKMTAAEANIFTLNEIMYLGMSYWGSFETTHPNWRDPVTLRSRMGPNLEKFLQIIRVTQLVKLCRFMISVSLIFPKSNYRTYLARVRRVRNLLRNECQVNFMDKITEPWEI